MKDKERGYLLVDIFKGSSAASYIDYYSRPRPEWEHLEKPMWNKLLGTLKNLDKAWALDVGTGTGKLFDLLIEAGMDSHNIVPLEPNSELAKSFSKSHKIGCILASSSELNHKILQNEYDLITANMVANHLNTNDFDKFIEFGYGVLKLDGYLLYVVPFPEEKAKKHGFDNNDNSVVIEEEAPWGGKVKYHHRSDEYQVKVLENNGFQVDRFAWGYDDFVEDSHLRTYEELTGKNLHSFKRMMFFARKVR